MAQGSGNADIRRDLEIIIKSMHMLPPWVAAETLIPGLERGGAAWWSRFKEVHERGWKTCHVPRRTWLDSKIDGFLEELAASSMHLDRQRAGELITRQLRTVAVLMRVTEATARTYLDDEIIKDMARRMLLEVAGERPGADLVEAPRTVPLPLALVGITVAALAEAMQVRAANEPPDHLGDVITTYAQTLSGLGQITRPRRAKAGRATRQRAWSRRRGRPRGSSPRPPLGSVAIPFRTAEWK